MQSNNLSPNASNTDIVNVKQQSLYARLKRLYATDVIVRNVGGKKLKIKDSDELMYATDRNSLRDRFNRVRSTSYNAQSRDFALSYQSARMDLFRDYDCIGPDTVIPLPDGSNPTIVELTEKYKNAPQKRFDVFSYDLENNIITVGKAYHPRLKGPREGWKVTFSNGQFVIGSEKHPFLMRNGEYKRIRELKVGELVMPFYQVELNTNGTREIVSIELVGMLNVYDVTVEKYHNFATDSCIVKNTMDMDPIISCLAPDTCISTLEGNIPIQELAERYPNGEKFHVWSWDKDEHKLTLGTAHHPRKTGTKNVIQLKFDNAQILKCTSDHRILLVDGTYKEAGQLIEGDALLPFDCKLNESKNALNIKSFGKQYSYVPDYIFTEVFCNPDEEYTVVYENGNCVDNRLTNILYTKNTTGRVSILNTDKFYSDAEYTLKVEALFPESINEPEIFNDLQTWMKVKHLENKRLKHANDLDRDQIYKIDPVITAEEVLVKGLTFTAFAEFARQFDFKGLVYKTIETKLQFLRNKLKESGYDNWAEYTANFKYNPRIVTGITDVNDSVDVYELTVDVHENFAIESGIIVSNSALDIYSDECLTENEMGEMLTIDSSNHNIKEILHNLFYDILNVEFNLWSWIRNMCKYGDFFLKLSISPEYGVYLVEPMSAYNVERIENSDPFNKNYVKYQIRPVDTSQAEVVESFQMAHFRLLSDSNFLPYGKCLVADTQVDTEVGRKYIKDLTVGEKVWSFNLKRRAVELTHVINKINSGVKEIIKISTEDTHVESSKPHPILVFVIESNKLVYKLAEDIKVGDLLVVNHKGTNRGSTTNTFFYDQDLSFEPVTNIEFTGAKETWDIQVESENSNFVANGLVVHNSMVEPARRVWKQLSLLEDAMLIHRIMRAPEKRIFKVDVGNIPPGEVENYMTQVITKMKKVPYIDDQTGDYNLKFNLMNMVEDFFLPTRGSDSGTSIDTLTGMTFTGIDDLEYVKNKMMAALKIPKAFLGFEEGLCVSPYTNIVLMDGQIKTVLELIHDYDNGIQNYVKSFDIETNTTVPGLIEWVGFTRLNTQIVRVYLNNGECIECTPDHEFMLFDDSYIEAQYLTDQHVLKAVDSSDECKVESVEWLEEKIDTCDLTIAIYHNFGTAAGVFVHNSGKATLAAEDVRFARTIGRLQKMVISELNKIAQVHLYSQGYRDSSIVDFTLGLTNPSTIFEKEKMEIWEAKLNNARSMCEMQDTLGPLFSREFVYQKIFKLSDDDIKTNATQVIDDCKQLWRMKSIAGDGVDPADPFIKIKPDVEGGDQGGGDSLPTGGGGGLTMKPPEEGPEGPKAGPEGGKPIAPAGELTELSLREKHGEHARDYKRPSQAGKKKATDYPFGEDPLGDKENHQKSRSSRLAETTTVTTTNISPNQFGMFSDLNDYLTTVPGGTIEIIAESTGDSMLDEKNIIE